MFQVEETSSSVAGSVFNVECILTESERIPVFFQDVALFTIAPLALFAAAAAFWFCVHPRLFRKQEASYLQSVSQHNVSDATLLRPGSRADSETAQLELAKLRRHWAANPKGHRQDRFIVSCIVIFFLLQVRWRAVGRWVAASSPLLRPGSNG